MGFFVFNGLLFKTFFQKHFFYLIKVNCSPYMPGSKAKLGYFPNGGTIKLNTRAMQTNTAGRTI